MSYRYRDPNDRRLKHYKICRLSDKLTLTDIRKRADLIRGEVKLGKSPAGERDRKRQLPTLDAFYRDEYLPRIKLKNRSWKSADLIYRKRLKGKWGGSRIDLITKSEVEGFLMELMERGDLRPATINHIGKVIRNLMSVAVSQELLERNRLAGLIRFPENNDDTQRLLTDEEMRLLVKTLNEDGSVAAKVALFALLTAARQGEILHSEWSQIDFENCVWNIPAANSKSKRGRRVPLSDAAVDLLNSLGSKGESRWVFVSQRRRDGELVRLTTVQKAWRERLRVRAELETLRFHDLRGNAISRLVRQTSITVACAVAGHHSVTQTERYNTVTESSMQQSVSALGGIVSEAMNAEVA